MKRNILLSIIFILFGCMVDISIASDSSFRKPKRQDVSSVATATGIPTRNYDAGDDDDEIEDMPVAVRADSGNAPLAVRPTLGYEVVETDDDDHDVVLDRLTAMLAMYFNGPALYRNEGGHMVRKTPLNRESVTQLMSLSEPQLRAFIANVIGVVKPQKDIDIKGKFAKVLQREPVRDLLGNIQPASDIIRFSNTKDLIETYSVKVIDTLFKVQCEDALTLTLYGRWVNIVLDELIAMQKEAYDQAVGQVQQEADAIAAGLKKQFDEAGTVMQSHNREYDQATFRTKFFALLGNVANIGSVLWLQPWKKNAEQAARLAQEQMAAASKRSIGRRAHQVSPVPKAKELSSAGYGQLYPWIHIGVFCGVTMWTLYRLKQAVQARNIRNQQPLAIQVKAKSDHARLHISLVGDDVLRTELQLLRDEVTLLLDEYKVNQERALIAAQEDILREEKRRGQHRIAGSQPRQIAQRPHVPQAAQSSAGHLSRHQSAAKQPAQESQKSSSWWPF